MRSSSMTTAAFALLSGLSVVSASYPLATITPCPSCPKGVCDKPITVTSQYQPVSTCTPMKTCSKGSCQVTPSCSTYDYVSTIIPCLGGKENTTVTATDQMISLSHVSTVLTSYYPVAVPCPTKAPTRNGTLANYKMDNCTSTSTSTKYQTMIVDTSCPYNELGPMALPSYEGSGLCKDCSPDVNGTKSQGVHVSKCLDGVCSTYAETWISRKPAPATSASVASYSSSAYCSAGVNTIPVTTVCTPTGGAYETPVTSSFYITTSVPQPQNVVITTVFTVYFSGNPAPMYPTSTSAAPVSAETYCTENGPHTIPIVQTITPSNSAYAPVTTTVMYTTTVTNAPAHVTCTTTVTVVFTTTYCPETVVSGSTIKPTTYPTGPATVSAGSTYPVYPVSTSASVTYPTYTASSSGVSYPTYPSSTMMTSTTWSSSSGSASSTTSGSTIPTPSPPATVGKFDFIGCLGSTDGFATFSLIESSGVMSVELCTTECLASGFNYAGLYTTDCYCASSLDDATGTDKTNGVCDLPCPGNQLETCGGNAISSPKLRNRATTNAILLDVYECPTPTSTTSTSSTESATTSSTPNPSSDPDPQPEARNINADMEPSAPIKARDDGKMRRGGMLRNANKVVKGPALAKRDYGLKKNALI